MNTHPHIPKDLFRGDSDPSGSRRLKDTYHFGQFQSNLINGGQGRLIFEQPLQELINFHVGTKWDKSHFLSFTENLKIAFHFGLNDIHFKLPDPIANTLESFDENPDFDFGLLTLRTDQVRWNIIEPAVFEGFYTPSLLEYSRLYASYRIILIGVLTALTQYNDTRFTTAIANAEKYKEWLLLPATPKLFNDHSIQFAGVLDGACISFKKMIKI